GGGGGGGGGGGKRCLGGIPGPSRPLLLELGSVGPIVPMGVSMAPRVPRAVPQGRPASRGTVIVSSGHDYNTDRRPCAREGGEALRALAREQGAEGDDVVLVVQAHRGRRGSSGPVTVPLGGHHARREHALGK